MSIITHTNALTQQKTYNPIWSYVIFTMCLKETQCDMGITENLPTCFQNSINFSRCSLTLCIFGFGLYWILVSIFLDKIQKYFPFKTELKTKTLSAEY